MHRQIMEDVTRTQNEGQSRLEEKLITILNSKLERQPTEFKIDTQTEQLHKLADEMKRTQERMILLDTRLEQVTIVLKEKRNEQSFR